MLSKHICYAFDYIIKLWTEQKYKKALLALQNFKIIPFQNCGLCLLLKFILLIRFYFVNFVWIKEILFTGMDENFFLFLLLLFKLLLKQKPELLNAINSCNYGPHTNRNLKKSLAMDDCNSFEIDIMLNALKHTCMTNNVSFF